MGTPRAVPRRRRLTLAPDALQSPASSSGSRFAALAEEEGQEGESEDSSFSAVPMAAAHAVLEDDGGGWTEVRSARRKTSEELIQDFWVNAGYPTPESRFWEKRSESSASPQGEI